MSLVDVLKSGSNLDIGAPMKVAEIEEFQRSLPGPLPNDVRQLLEYASGFSEASFGRIDFTGASNTFVFREMFPYGLPIAQQDGNFWVVDIAQDGCWRSVFFVSHDPAVALIQFPSFSAFLRNVVTKEQVLIDAQSLSARIWKDRAPGILVDVARSSSDVVLSKFASELPDDFEIYDLRDNVVGNGFSWGRNGPQTDCRRASTELLFALERSDVKKGLLKRLFSR